MNSRKLFLILSLVLMVVPSFVIAQEEEEEEAQPIVPKGNYIRTTRTSLTNLKGSHAMAEEEEAQTRTAPYTKGASVRAEEEEAQTRPSPFTRNSQTMRFMANAFGSFSGQSIKSLKAGKTIRMTAKKNINARNAGFAAGKGQAVLISAKKGGICLQKGKKGMKTKGIILHNSAKNNMLLVTSRTNFTQFKGSMAINSNGMKLNAKPVNQMK